MGRQSVIEYLINTARGFIFTTGIPAAACVGAEAALDIVEAEPGRRERLWANGGPMLVCVLLSLACLAFSYMFHYGLVIS